MWMHLVRARAWALLLCCTQLQLCYSLGSSVVGLVESFTHWDTSATVSALTAAHFSPGSSLLAGAAAGLTRSVSRLITYPLDTVKTRRQISKLSEDRLDRMPPRLKALALKPEDREGLFSGIVPFLLQAAPSNALFFLT